MPRHQTDKYSQLKQQFEECHSLVLRARERATRAAEEAMALRSLAQARARDTSPQRRDVWAAAAQAVAEMARERDRILGTVSHEMRQALSAAVAAQRVLVTRTADPTTTKAAVVLDRQLTHLEKLVELLLDYSRLMVGTPGLCAGIVDVREIIRDTIEACESTAQQSGIEMSLSVWPQPQRIFGDATRLRQLFSNLVHNALRYTPPGGRVHCATSTSHDEVRIVVSDTGAGIEEDELQRIFQPFTRGSVEGEGLGVGLAIARRIAQLHGGAITARSEGAGKGSTFTVVVPLAQPPE